MLRLLLVCCLAVGTLASHAQSLLQSGPMVGAADYKEVSLWVQTTAPAKVQFAYWEQDQPKTRQLTAEVQTESRTAFVAKAVADKVTFGKVYDYELLLNGKAVKLGHPLTFRTLPLWQHRTDAPDVLFALGSCAFVAQESDDRPGKPYGGDYQIFTSIWNQKPAFMLWLGDNTYLREPDWGSRTGILARNTHTRSLKELQPLLGNTSHYAIWDDHDYGPNDADRSFWNKQQTAEAFKLFWANPVADALGNGGTTSRFEWSDCEFFLLDDRWSRTAMDIPAPDRKILGDEQLDWLVNSLAYSKATFKFVALGSQVLNSAASKENMSNFPAEREKLLKALHDRKVQGVVFLSGDRHFTELSKMPRDGAYPLYDLTVSPLTSGAFDPKNETNTFRIPETLVSQRNFATIWVSGAKGARTLTIRVYDSNGKEVWNRNIAASELKY